MIKWFKLPDERPVSPAKDIITISVNGEIERVEFHDGQFWTLKENLAINDGYYAYWTYGCFPKEYAE